MVGVCGWSESCEGERCKLTKGVQFPLGTSAETMLSSWLTMLQLSMAARTQERDSKDGRDRPSEGGESFGVDAAQRRGCS